MHFLQVEPHNIVQVPPYPNLEIKYTVSDRLEGSKENSSFNSKTYESLKYNN